jgi:hypothetical protein
MFVRQWALAGRARPLASIAIVDEAPEQQYLYPEFLLLSGFPNSTACGVSAPPIS